MPKSFESPLDIFLKQQREQLPKSASQRSESQKYERIKRLRDKAEREEKSFWEEF